MPVALVLNDEQKEVFDNAMKGSKIELAVRGRQISLTRENWKDIRDAVQKLKDKRFNVRSKTIMHMETCFQADIILSRIDTLVKEFDNHPIPEVDNDNATLVVVEDTEEVEESASDSEEESDSGTDNGSEG